MKYYGKINDPKDLVTAEYVDENGGKIDSIKVNGVTQPIGSDKSIDISAASANDTGVITTGDQNLSGIKTIYGDNSGLAFDREGSNNSLGFVMKNNGNLALKIM